MSPRNTELNFFQIVFFTLLSVALMAPALAHAEENQAAIAAFDKGNELMGARKYCDARQQYENALAAFRDNPDVLYNAAFATYLCGELPRAVELFLQLREMTPNDWQVRAKLIQLYQRLNKSAERDAERTALLAAWKSGTNPDLTSQTEYCRDRFTAGGEQVMVFEHFELKGDRALRYVFGVMDASGKSEKYRITLGSYETTNTIWHESTEPRPKPEERLFHLDGYYDQAHATYGFYSPEPSYDDVRQQVINILENKAKPLSSTIVPAKSKQD